MLHVVEIHAKLLVSKFTYISWSDHTGQYKFIDNKSGKMVAMVDGSAGWNQYFDTVLVPNSSTYTAKSAFTINNNDESPWMNIVSVWGNVNLFIPGDYNFPGQEGFMGPAPPAFGDSGGWTKVDKWKFEWVKHI